MAASLDVSLADSLVHQSQSLRLKIVSGGEAMAKTTVLD